MFEKYFFSDNNFKLIMSVLYEHFKNNENYIVDEQEEGLVINLMKINFQKNSKGTNEKLKDYLLRLNRIVLKNSIDIITKQLIEDRKNEEKLNVTNDEINNEYERLLNERKTVKEEDKEKVMKEIQKDIETDNTDVMKTFDNINKVREDEEKEITENLKGLSFDNNKFSKKQEFAIINEDAPKPSGQDLLIQQPEDFKKLVDSSFKNNNNYIKEHFILIDSRDRNTNDYPDTNNYQVDLNQDYKEILKVELISSNIPKTEYLINLSNNNLTFSVSSTTYDIQIPIGNYDINTLATALQNAMNAAGSGLSFTVSVISLTNKINISSTSNFELLFNGGTELYNQTERAIYKENSIGKILGFSPTDLSGALTYTSDKQYNLHGPTYILLHISEFNNIDGLKSSVQDAFAKIPLDTSHNEYKFFKNSNDYCVETVFSPPLAKLSQLNVRFLNYDGSFYDFGGLEHSFLIKLRCLNQSQGYFIN